MRLSRATKRKIKALCNKHKNDSNFQEKFSMTMYDMRTKRIKRNYKEIKQLHSEKAKSIKSIIDTENQMSEAYDYILNHELSKTNTQMINDFHYNIMKYCYKISHNRDIKKYLNGLR